MRIIHRRASLGEKNRFSMLLRENCIPTSFPKLAQNEYSHKCGVVEHIRKKTWNSSYLPWKVSSEIGQLISGSTSLRLESDFSRLRAVDAGLCFTVSDRIFDGIVVLSVVLVTGKKALQEESFSSVLRGRSTEFDWYTSEIDPSALGTL